MDREGTVNTKLSRIRSTLQPLTRWLTMAGGLLTAGCLQTGYLVQAVAGQDDISYRARPVSEVLTDESVPADTRQLLGMMGDVKRYGEQHGLKPTNNYQAYADLKRKAAVWVVSASHPLRFEPVTWWFPIVGSVPYLGWFHKRDAHRFAEELRDDGYDADLRGARAYSTLGWFADPVLSTMIPRRDARTGDLVNVVLHESVHATHYVSSQSPFNESMADFIADALTLNYLQDELHLERRLIDAYLQAEHDRAGRAKRFHETYLKLEALYASALPARHKRTHKKLILSSLQRELGLRRTINNATLAQSKTYHGGEAIFEKVFEHCGRSWPPFWRALRQIDTESFSEPHQAELSGALGPLLARPCGSGSSSPHAARHPRQASGHQRAVQRRSDKQAVSKPGRQ